MKELLRALTFAAIGTALIACGESDSIIVDPASFSLTNSVLTVDSADFVEEAHLFVHGCETAGTGRPSRRLHVHQLCGRPGSPSRLLRPPKGTLDSRFDRLVRRMHPTLP
mgnify:CR=1 FL=1